MQRSMQSARPAVLALGAAALLLSASLPGPAAAQEARRPDPSAQFRASPYLPLGHWAYPMLDYWIAAGRLNRLSPFVQPYRRMDVARALLSLEEEHLKPFEERWLRRLEDELAPEMALLRGDRKEASYAAVGFSGGAEDWTQTSRDPLRPELHGRFAKNRVLEHVSVDAEAQAGPVAGALRGVRDGIFRHDAQYPNGRVIPKQSFILLDEAGIRVQEAYAELQTKYARLFAGRMRRNWGPPHTLGFLRSSYAYSWDEIGWRVGSDRIFATGSFATFSDFPGDTARYFAVHRLEWRARDNLMLGVSESIIEGGPNANLDFRLLNPIGVWELTTKESKKQRNNVGQADVWWRPANGLVLWGSLLADATTSIEKTDKSCCQLGGTVGIQMPGIARGWSLRLQGTAMQSLVYRTRLPWEEYTVDHVGLGWDKGDLYLATAEASWFGRAGLVLKPRVDIQVKGEGDFHGRLRPPADSLPAFPRILVGQTETTIRPAVAGTWHREMGNGWGLDMDWDVGVSFIRDFGHRAGTNATALVGTLRVLLRTPRFLLPLD